MSRDIKAFVYPAGYSAVTVTTLVSESLNLTEEYIKHLADNTRDAVVVALRKRAAEL